MFACLSQYLSQIITGMFRLSYSISVTDNHGYVPFVLVNVYVIENHGYVSLVLVNVYVRNSRVCSVCLNQCLSQIIMDMFRLS
jgi:hypothetical protein